MRKILLMSVVAMGANVVAAKAAHEPATRKSDQLAISLSVADPCLNTANQENARCKEHVLHVRREREGTQRMRDTTGKEIPGTEGVYYIITSDYF